MIDWCWRSAYWIGFRLARLWWRITRPEHHGALVAIWCNGCIVVVRQSYRGHLTLPGGGIRRGEAPHDAARRELAEELGLSIAANDLVLVREVTVDWDFCNDHVRIFELHLDVEPRLKIDNREIVEARLVDPRDLPSGKGISRILRIYLRGEGPPVETQPPSPTMA